LFQHHTEAAFGFQSDYKIEYRNPWEEPEYIKNIIYHQQRIMRTMRIMKILLDGIDANK
jgi:hypothetical protein